VTLYDWQACARRMERLYEETLTGGLPAAPPSPLPLGPGRPE
jgi:hypothetical protein